MDWEDSYEIVLGTYEEFVVGYTLIQTNNKFSLKRCFADHAHCGSVRTVASSSKYLASGSSDEIIKLYNLKTRVEHGSLQQHTGTITDVKFHKDSYLFSASDDNSICIWKTNSWNCEKILRGHSGGITSISIHPSGKLALSVSKDRTLRTWNLIKGRCAYTTNIKAVSELVLWSPDGSLYAVIVNSKVDIYSVEIAGVINTIDFGKRIISVVFITDKYIAIGGEGINIVIYSTKEMTKLCDFEAHDNRIKCLSIAPSKNQESFLLFSASSDGFIKVWKILLNQIKVKPECLAQVNTACRITCMSVAAEQQGEKHAAEESEAEETVNSVDEDKSDKEIEEADIKTKTQKIAKQTKKVKRFKKKIKTDR